jgi:phage terminase small subunit
MAKKKPRTSHKARTTAPRTRKLSAKRLRFCEEYLKDSNGTQAAIRAGYSPRTAKEQAAELLTIPNVAAEIVRRQAKLAKKCEIEAAQVVKEFAKIGFANMADYMVFDTNGDPSIDFARLTRDQTAAIGEVTLDYYTEGQGREKQQCKRVRFKLHDKNTALANLGKHLGMFVTRLQVEDTGLSEEDAENIRKTLARRMEG